MSQTAARRHAQQLVQSLESGHISPEGSCSAQEKGNSVYALVPGDVADAKGIEQGTELVLGYHAASSTWLVAARDDVVDGHWAENFI